MSGMISRTGRRALKTRMLYAIIYFLLVIGSATMVYPFLLMISGSTKSAVDIRNFNVVPRFFRDNTWLYRKHIEGIFNESPHSMRLAYDTTCSDFRHIKPPSEYNFLLAEEFEQWLKETRLPWYAAACGYLDTPVSKTKPLNLRRLKPFLEDKYGGAINAVNRELGTEFTSWSSLKFRTHQFLLRHEENTLTPYFKTLDEFTAAIACQLKFYFSPSGLFRQVYLPGKYGKDHAARHLARSYPENAPEREREDWEDFVRNVLSVHWISIDGSAEPAYREFLAAKHLSIDALNKYYGTGYADFSAVRLADRQNFLETAQSDWELFIRSRQTPIHALHITSTETRFQDHARNKFRTIERFNDNFGTSYTDFDHICLPQADLHYAWFLRNTGFLRKEFCTRNYKAVWEYVVLHGRGVLNTALYCLLAIACALIVNPLAAYALSRFRLPAAYKILLFLLCTMAFPPMVTSIPNFLILRKLGLLNTFAALILPAMANGYSIFLLKGFFDSQPREIYESAQLDGAGEWVLFWQITMSLSKPILAVIALQAFMLAYSNFMFAFIVCQDEKMWTLMVWLYQLQQRTGQAVVYASLIIAAIPTFLVFLSCQNIIMRGIVVPSEK